MENYANIPQNIVVDYMKRCKTCKEKLKIREITTGIVIKPMIIENFNDRGQVDMIDFQSLPHRNFKYVMHYQDYLSKNSILRPLTTKRVSEVACHLLQIFIDFGAPAILQSDNGREFTAKVIEAIVFYYHYQALIYNNFDF